MNTRDAQVTFKALNLDGGEGSGVKGHTTLGGSKLAEARAGVEQARNLGHWTDGNGSWLHGKMSGDEVMTTGRDGVAWCSVSDWNSTVDDLIQSGWTK
jgi:hypothetical protein